MRRNFRAFSATSAQAQATYELRRPVSGLSIVAEPGQGQPSGSLSLSASTLSFDSVATNSSQSRQLSLTNASDNPVVFNSPAVSLSGSAAFGAASTSCAGTLAPGASCAVQVAFSPTEPGSYSGQLTVSSNAVGSPLQVALNGNAFNPVSLQGATMSAAMEAFAYSYDFSGALEVSNESEPDLSQAAWTISPAPPAGLTLDPSTGVLSGTPIAAQASTTYTVGVTYKGNRAAASFTLEIVPKPASGIVVSGTTASFGTVNIGATSTRTFTVTNLSPVSNVTVSRSGLSAPMTHSGCSASLPPEASCELTVTYTPTTTAAINQTLTLGGGGTSRTVAVTGTGRSFSLSTPSLAFGDVTAGESSTLSFTVTNPSNGLDRNNPSITVSGTRYSTTHNCPATLAAGSSCEVSVTFSPTTAESPAGTVFVGFTGVPTQSVALTGTGRQPILVLSSTNFNTGSVNIGSTNSITRTLTNTGNQTAQLVFGELSAATQFFTRSTTCGATLVVGGTCNITVTYAPTQLSNTTSSTGNFTVSAFRTSVTGNYSGTGVALSSISFGFGIKGINSGNHTLTQTLTNTSNLTLTGPSISIPSGQFVVSSTTCTGNLAPGGSCSISVRYTATATAASHSANLSVGYSGIATRLYSASGSSEMFTLSGASVAFGTYNVNTTSITISRTITNVTGSSISNLVVTAPGNSVFTRTTNCPTSLASGSSCTVSFTFRPTSVISYSSSVTVSGTTGTYTRSQNITLSGAGAN